MSAVLQVRHSFWMGTNQTWNFYTVGPFHGEGWLCAVGHMYYTVGSTYGGFSFSLVGSGEGSQENHLAGVNLLSPGGDPGYLLGSWQARSAWTAPEPKVLWYPFWTYLQTGAHWVSIAVDGMKPTTPTWSGAWAAVVSKSFVDGVLGVGGLIGGGGVGRRGG